MNCVYPTSSTPYEIAVCVVTGKQIAEHHDMICETPAWAIAYHKKKGHHRIDHHDEAASSRHDEGILAWNLRSENVGKHDDLKYVGSRR